MHALIFEDKEVHTNTKNIQEQTHSQMPLLFEHFSFLILHQQYIYEIP